MMAFFFITIVLFGLIFIPLLHRTARAVLSPYTKANARNFLFIIPGMNLVALGVEVYLIFKDKQGMRLGDQLAKTQVVEGKELPEVAKWFQFILDYYQKIADAEQLQNEPAQSGKNR